MIKTAKIVDMVNNLKKTGRIALFFVTYSASVAAIWGLTEAFTYFTGDSLKQLMGSYWWAIFYGVPLIIASLKLVFCHPPAQVIPLSPIVAGKSTEEIRSINRVRPLDRLEDDLEISRLPNGIYGYEVPWMLNEDRGHVPGGTRVDKLSLKRMRGGTSIMEIHKSSFGQIYLIGFVTDNNLLLLQDPSRSERVHFLLFFVAHEEFRRPIAIPIERIISFKRRNITKIGEAADVVVQ